MRVSYWHNINSTLFRKTLKIEDGINDTLDIEIDCEDGIVRKLKISRDGVSYRLVEQKDMFSPEKIVVERDYIYKDFERIDDD